MKEPCREKGHTATCEGGSLHVARRDNQGCAQFHDGSWITKDRRVCWEEHPGQFDAGAGPRTLEWIEDELERGRR